MANEKMTQEDFKLHQMANEQEANIAIEDRERKTLWALEGLVSDGMITTEMPFKEVFKIVRKRKKELENTINYAGDVEREDRTDNDYVSNKFHDMASEEINKALPFLGYLEAADQVLTHINIPGFDQEQPLKNIQNQLKNHISRIEQEH